MSARPAAAKPHVLHLHSTFAPGGKERRTVQLINGFGQALRHTIVSAEPEETGAAALIDRGIAMTLQPEFPSLKGLPMPGRLNRLARAMRGYDLVLTYNWGAMDAVMAHTLFSEAYELPPLIHHEDGFDEEELLKRKRRRTWYRRIALGRAAGLVVPSELLEEIALVEWQQPLGRVKRISNGIDTKAFAKKPRNDAIRRLLKRPGENWVGTLAGLRKVKNLPRLVRAFAPLPENWHLVICGEGPERAAIEAEADRLGINHRVHLPGAVADPAKVIGLFDIFALSSDSEQFPLSVIEAMAAGRPVVAPEVGDIAEMVSDANRNYLAAHLVDEALEAELVTLSIDKRLREEIGAANRAKARAEFDEANMLASYRRLYSSAMRSAGKDGF
ncbi:glycosyl transferase family 1 [Erythrobacter sp. QSSC1-22B]|uniref:glycosyltransferase family 4 protein n=1 Tax=Erythrobacter sp. QSSC1-22B TaxID=1860125 RepID=UPI000804BC37|nr:glycosyltransferase family 4 protein [Erythrobacter sp. QSSC1-22B]OBX18531.1 glycosyl transferase family 1 [Erythrobacter sp. QSSC1-22B]